LFVYLFHFHNDMNISIGTLKISGIGSTEF